MKVHHLNCATMRPPGGRLVSGTGTIRGAMLVAHCLLIETDNGLVLVDTGFGLQDVAAPKTLPAMFRVTVRPALDIAETAAAQVEALGFARSDVRNIVCTHLDLDHAGGLRDFPEAAVHVSATELVAAQNPKTLGENWNGFAAVRDLAGLPPEILMVPLAGHTRGHSGIAVDTGSEWLLHAGDAYFHHGQMHQPPSCPAGLKVFQVLMQTERDNRVANVERLRELAADPRVTVFSAHDRHEYDQLKETDRP
jgi:glyoxylase-like metal-dependent hydrolase (beta-lactamase superfamily II)